MIKFRQLALKTARLAYQKKCNNIVILDIHELTTVCDYFVIATVDSLPQMNAVRGTIIKSLKDDGYQQLYSQKNVSSSWQILDFAGLVIHLMTPTSREFYALDRIWYKAKKINWYKKTRKKLKKR